MSKACVLLSVFIETIVQAYYIRRISILTEGNRPLTYCAGALWVLRACFGFGGNLDPIAFLPGFTTDPALSQQLSLYSTTGLPFSGIMKTAVTVSAATDAVITGILVRSLHLRRTGMKETDHIIQRLMMYLVHTGAITTVCLITTVILFATKPDLSYMGLYFLSSKFYANSFLGTLNARLVFRNPGGSNAPDVIKFIAKPSEPPMVRIHLGRAFQ
ncbi:hypothetical protein NLI96_g792 [Meripilus lineatus]|uniref:DUF6534 domain-containing protein n=1 Tax=Meripilus lineatus TaxID=2056292 RepID=A0AAD5VBL8_9APHY|nr:hypothetical protein NLI96_g792 [Physisporinus lineatus]